MDLQEMSEALIRIDERTKALLERRDDHETRLRGLERWRNFILGGTAVATALLGYIIKMKL
jgi:hypothetical protein